MSLKKVLSMFLACALCLSIFCVGASASSKSSGSEYRGTASLISGDGYYYKAWCTLYVSDVFKAAVWVEKNGSILNPPNMLQYMAYLYDGNGKLKLSSSAEANTAQSYFPPAMTGSWGGDSAFAGGKVWLQTTYGDNETINLYPTATYSIGRSAANLDLVLEMLSASLNEDGQYPVNMYGESYGSALLYEIVGEEPDLIEAVGTDGTEGYVRATDLHPFYDVDEGEDVIIPLYDINGVEISSFILG